MFLKNPDAVIGPGDTVMLPDMTEPWVHRRGPHAAAVRAGE